MSLDGAQLNYVDAAGAALTLKAKGRKFNVGSLCDSDLVLSDAAERLHCDIQCDGFGRVTIQNYSSKEPIYLNDQIVHGKRPLLHGARIKILNVVYTWNFPKTAVDATPDRAPLEPAPNSSPSLKAHRQRRQFDNRFTLHNFRYSINSDDEGNTSIESRELDASSISNAETTTEPKRSITPPGIEMDETIPKVDLLEATQNKENTSTVSNKLMLELCARSDVVITSFSPRETGVKVEKSFTCVLKPSTGFGMSFSTITTPKSVYNTPKTVLSELNDDSCSRDLMEFSTPSTSKKALAAKNKSSMFLIDLTTPQRLQRSTLSVTPRRTPGSVEVINVDSTDESSDASPLVIDITSSTPVTTPAAKQKQRLALKTPKEQLLAAGSTPKRTPQSLMKRAILTSAKKQILQTTPTVPTPNRQPLLDARRQCLTAPRRLPFHPRPQWRTPGRRPLPAVPSKTAQTSPRKQRLSTSCTLSSPRDTKVSQLRKSMAAARKLSPNVNLGKMLVAKARRSLNSPKHGSPKFDSPKLSSPKCDSPKRGSPKPDSSKCDSSKRSGTPKVLAQQFSPNESSTPERTQDSSGELSRTFTIDDNVEQPLAASAMEVVAALVTDEYADNENGRKSLDRSPSEQLEEPREEKSKIKCNVSEESIQLDEDSNLDQTFEANVSNEKIQPTSPVNTKTTKNQFIKPVVEQTTAVKAVNEDQPDQDLAMNNAEAVLIIEDGIGEELSPTAVYQEDVVTVTVVQLAKDIICEEVSTSEEDTFTTNAHADPEEHDEEDVVLVAPPGGTPMPRRSTRRFSADQNSVSLTPRRRMRRASTEASNMLNKLDSKPTRRASCSAAVDSQLNVVATPKRKCRLTDELSTPTRKSLRLLTNTPKKTLVVDDSVGDMGVIVEEDANQAEADNKLPTVSVSDEDYGSELPATPAIDDTDKIDYQGMRELLKTPKSCSTPRFKGLRELMRTPKVHPSPMLGDIKEMLENDSNDASTTPKRDLTVGRVTLETTCDAQDMYFKTPRGKNLMIPNDPASAVLKTCDNSIETTTEYDLNASNATLHLDKIFDDVLVAESTDPAIAIDDSEAEMNVTAVSTAAVSIDIDPLSTTAATANDSVASEALINICNNESSSKDPLTSTAFKPGKLSKLHDECNADRGKSPGICEMSGIQMLDQTTDSMFSEALVVTGVDSFDLTVDETKATPKQNMHDEISDTDSTVGLAEPLVVSDDEENVQEMELISCAVKLSHKVSNSRTAEDSLSLIEKTIDMNALSEVENDLEEELPTVDQKSNEQETDVSTTSGLSVQISNETDLEVTDICLANIENKRSSTIYHANVTKSDAESFVADITINEDESVIELDASSACVEFEDEVAQGIKLTEDANKDEQFIELNLQNPDESMEEPITTFAEESKITIKEDVDCKDVDCKKTNEEENIEESEVAEQIEVEVNNENEVCVEQSAAEVKVVDESLIEIKAKSDLQQDVLEVITTTDDGLSNQIKPANQNESVLSVEASSETENVTPIEESHEQSVLSAEGSSEQDAGKHIIESEVSAEHSTHHLKINEDVSQDHLSVEIEDEVVVASTAAKCKLHVLNPNRIPKSSEELVTKATDHNEVRNDVAATNLNESVIELDASDVEETEPETLPKSAKISSIENKKKVDIEASVFDTDKKEQQFDEQTIPSTDESSAEIRDEVPVDATATNVDDSEVELDASGAVESEKRDEQGPETSVKKSADEEANEAQVDDTATNVNESVTELNALDVSETVVKNKTLDQESLTVSTPSNDCSPEVKDTNKSTTIADKSVIDVNVSLVHNDVENENEREAVLFSTEAKVNLPTNIPKSSEELELMVTKEVKADLEATSLNKSVIELDTSALAVTNEGEKQLAEHKFKTISTSARKSTGEIKDTNQPEANIDATNDAVIELNDSVVIESEEKDEDLHEQEPESSFEKSVVEAEDGNQSRLDVIGTNESVIELDASVVAETDKDDERFTKAQVDDKATNVNESVTELDVSATQITNKQPNKHEKSSSAVIDTKEVQADVETTNFEESMNELDASGVAETKVEYCDEQEQVVISTSSEESLSGVKDKATSNVNKSEIELNASAPAESDEEKEPLDELKPAIISVSPNKAEDKVYFTSIEIESKNQSEVNAHASVVQLDSSCKAESKRKKFETSLSSANEAMIQLEAADVVESEEEGKHFHEKRPESSSEKPIELEGTNQSQRDVNDAKESVIQLDASDVAEAEEEYEEPKTPSVKSSIEVMDTNKPENNDNATNESLIQQDASSIVESEEGEKHLNVQGRDTSTEKSSLEVDDTNQSVMHVEDTNVSLIQLDASGVPEADKEDSEIVATSVEEPSANLHHSQKDNDIEATNKNKSLLDLNAHKNYTNEDQTTENAPDSIPDDDLEEESAVIDQNPEKEINTWDALASNKSDQDEVSDAMPVQVKKPNDIENVIVLDDSCDALDDIAQDSVNLEEKSTPVNEPSVEAKNTASNFDANAIQMQVSSDANISTAETTPAEVLSVPIVDRVKEQSQSGTEIVNQSKQNDSDKAKVDQNEEKSSEEPSMQVEEGDMDLPEAQETKSTQIEEPSIKVNVSKEEDKNQPKPTQVESQARSDMDEMPVAETTSKKVQPIEKDEAKLNSSTDVKADHNTAAHSKNIQNEETQLNEVSFKIIEEQALIVENTEIVEQVTSKQVGSESQQKAISKEQTTLLDCPETRQVSTSVISPAKKGEQQPKKATRRGRTPSTLEEAETEAGEIQPTKRETRKAPVTEDHNVAHVVDKPKRRGRKPVDNIVDTEVQHVEIQVEEKEDLDTASNMVPPNKTLESEKRKRTRRKSIADVAEIEAKDHQESASQVEKEVTLEETPEMEKTKRTRRKAMTKQEVPPKETPESTAEVAKIVAKEHLEISSHVKELQPNENSKLQKPPKKTPDLEKPKRKRKATGEVAEIDAKEKLQIETHGEKEVPPKETPDLKNLKRTRRKSTAQVAEIEEKEEMLPEEAAELDKPKRTRRKSTAQAANIETDEDLKAAAHVEKEPAAVELEKPKRRGRNPAPAVVDTATAVEKLKETTDMEIPKRLGRKATTVVDETETHVEKSVEDKPNRRVQKPTMEVSNAEKDKIVETKSIKEEKSPEPTKEKPKRRAHKASEEVTDAVEDSEPPIKKAAIVEILTSNEEKSPEPTKEKPKRRARKASAEVTDSVEAAEPPEKRPARNARKASAETVERQPTSNEYLEKIVEATEPEQKKLQLLEVDLIKSEISEAMVQAAPAPTPQGTVEASGSREKIATRQGRKATTDAYLPDVQTVEPAELKPKRRGRKPSAEVTHTEDQAVKTAEKSSSRLRKPSADVELKLATEAEPPIEKKLARRGRKPSAVETTVEEPPQTKKTTTRRGRKRSLSTPADEQEKQLDVQQLSTQPIVPATVVSTAIQQPSPEDELTPRRREGRNLPRKNYAETLDEDKLDSSRKGRKPLLNKLATSTSNKPGIEAQTHPKPTTPVPTTIAVPTTPTTTTPAASSPVAIMPLVATPAAAAPPAEPTTSQKREGRNVPRKNYNETWDEEKPSTSRARRLRTPTVKALELLVDAANSPITSRRRKGKLSPVAADVVAEEPPEKKMVVPEEESLPVAAKARGGARRKAAPVDEVTETAVAAPAQSKRRKQSADVLELDTGEKQPVKRNAARGGGNARKTKAVDEQTTNEQPATKKTRGVGRSKTPVAVEPQQVNNLPEPEEVPATKRAAPARGRAARAAKVDEVETVQETAPPTPRAARGRKVHFEATEEATTAATLEHQSAAAEAPKRAKRTRRN